MALQMALSMPLADIMAFRKVRSAEEAWQPPLTVQLWKEVTVATNMYSEEHCTCWMSTPSR